MSDFEKDEQDAESIDVDFDEFDNLKDFVDLENLEELGEMADLDALQDLEDLDSLVDLASDMPDDKAFGEDLFPEADLDNDGLLDGQGVPVDMIPDDLPDIDALESGSLEEDILPKTKTVFPEEKEDSEIHSEVTETDSDVDSMLDGLLDNLDATGSLDEELSIPAEDASTGSREEKPVDAMEEDMDDGMDELLNMLGGTGLEEEDSLAAEDALTESGIEDGLSNDAEDAFSDAMEDILALDSQEESGDTSSQEEEADEEILSLMDEPELPEPEPEQPEEKKPGLLKRLFGNVITDEIAEAELAQRAAEKEAAEAKAEEDAKKKEEQEKVKAEKAEAKAARKAEKAEQKAAQKAKKAEAKAAKKAEKQAKKEEEAAQAELEVTGKLNKVGVSIIVILTVMFLVTEISGTQIFSYRSTIKEAQDYLEAKKYTRAYQEILGTDVKKEDRETYDKIMTVMKVQRSINAYECYRDMEYGPDALNALLVGLRRYDENIEAARNLEIEDDMDSCKEEILTLLQEEFRLSESEAYDILSLEKEEYTEKVVALGMDKE